MTSRIKTRHPALLILITVGPIFSLVGFTECCAVYRDARSVSS
jgi:hypothetical protein